MEVYYDSVAARVPVVGAAGAPVDVDITYQGCAEAGLCYPPITKTASLLLPTALAGTGGGATNPTDAGSGANTLGQSNLSRGANAGASDTYGLPGPGTANVVPIVPELPGPEWTGAAPLELPEQDRVDWCVSCKEMERFTFSDPQVQAALSNVLLLQTDFTANDALDRGLLAEFSLFGPPAIQFFGPDGRERRELRVIGYRNSGDFRRVVGRATAPARSVAASRQSVGPQFASSCSTTATGTSRTASG